MTREDAQALAHLAHRLAFRAPVTGHWHYAELLGLLGAANAAADERDAEVMASARVRRWVSAGERRASPEAWARAIEYARAPAFVCRARWPGLSVEVGGELPAAWFVR